MKTPMSILDKLIDSAIMRKMSEWGMRPKRGKPGELVLALSDEDRKILEELQARAHASAETRPG